MQTRKIHHSSFLYNKSFIQFSVRFSTLLVLTLLFISAGLHAQDIIIKKDGTEIEAKVQEINANSIKYNRFEMTDGPLYEIEKSEVFMIKYPNGQKDIFTEKPQVKETEAIIKQIPNKSIALQKNAIGLNPLMYALDLGIKFGYIEYEKLIGDNYSIGGRIVRVEKKKSDYWEESTGGGIFIRKYFNGGLGLKGFYLGSNLDIFYEEWGEWWGTVGDSTYELGKGTSMVFTAQLGGKICIGESFYLDPSIAVGYYKSNTSSSYSEYNETGAIAFPSVTMGFKF